MMSGWFGQKGFTMIELVASLGVTGMILTAAASFYFYEVRGVSTIKASVAASQDIGNAGRLISSDAMMAKSSDLVDGAASVDTLTLTWTEWYKLAATPHTSTYWLSGSELKRDYDGMVSTAARDISSIAFSQADRVITVVISATPSTSPPHTFQQTFRAWLRTKE